MAGNDLILNMILRLKDEATDKLNGVKKGLGELGPAAMAMSAATIGAITAVGGAALKLTSDAIAIPGVARSFDALGGSIERMREASLGMITDVDLMRQYNMAAQLVGQDFAQTLPDAMEVLTKVSASTGQSMEYMLDSLVRGIGRLSPRILDNIGITVSLEQATERAAQMFGVETDEVSRAQQQAGLMAVAMEALRTNTANIPDVAGTAAQQMAALHVTFQNIKDQVGVALIPVLQALLTPLLALAQEHGPNVILWAQQFAETLQANLIPILIVAATLVIPGLVVALYTMATAAWAAAAPLMSILGPIIAIGAAVALLAVAWSNDWGGIRTTLTEFWEQTAKPILQNLLTWFTETLPEGLHAIANWFTVTWMRIKAGITFYWDFIAAYFEGLWNVITGAIRTAWNIVVDFFTHIWESIRLGIQTAWTVIKALLSFFWDLIVGLTKPIWEPVATFLSDLWERISTKVTEIWNTIHDFLNGKWDAIASKVTEIWNTIHDFLSLKWEMISTLVRLKAELVRVLLASVWDAILEKVKEVWTTISDWLSNLWGNVYGTASRTFGALSERVMKIFSDLKDGVKWMWGLIQASISDVVSNLWENVFEHPLWALKEKWVGFWNEVKQWIGNILGNIHIPMPHITVHYQDIPILGRIPSGASVDWYAKGLDAVISSPTLIGVGEAGPERVIVQPLGRGRSGAGGSQQVQYVLNYTAMRPDVGELDAARVMRELELRARLRFA